MSRYPIALEVTDLSTFARALRDQLAKAERPPGHVELLNMLARAAGRRNYQHLRRDATAADRLAAARPAPGEPPDQVRIEKLLRHFDAAGRLMRWPGRASLQELSLWAFWSRLPPRTPLSDREISALLREWHDFGDHALLRRAMVDYRLVSRTVDGREYRRIEQPPPPELGPLLEQLERRRAA